MEHNFRIQVEIRSGPAALPGFRFCSRRWIPFIEKTMLFIGGYDLEFIIGILLFSLVNAERNCLLSTSALDIRDDIVLVPTSSDATG